MTKRILMLCCAIFMVCQTVAFAHSLPREELYIGGVGVGCSLGYVKSVYGEPEDERTFEGDGIRSVTYIYSPTFSITGRTGIRDDRADEDMIVVGFTSTDASLATPSGIRVGTHYRVVKDKFGGVKKITFRNGEKAYVYKVNNGHEMCFYVNDDNTIIKIKVGTEI